MLAAISISDKFKFHTMRKFFLLICIILIYKTNSFATKQAGDLLIFNNDTIIIYQYPLDKFYNKGDFYNPGFFADLSTTCYRGYIAVWTIVDNKLYLKDIYDCNRDKKINIEIIGKQKDNQNLIFADWYDASFKINMKTKEEIILPWNIGRLFIHKVSIKINKGNVVKNK
jgi:hypothetical protein